MAICVKKVGILLLTAILIFSLPACGKKHDTHVTEKEEMEFAEFEWPDTEIAKLMPVPKSNIGNIYWSETYGFVIYVANTSQADYADYVKECEEAGFILDGRKGDDFFWADNEDGYQATVRYQEGNVMFIRIDDPDDGESTESEPEQSPSEFPVDKTETVSEQASAETPKETVDTPSESIATETSNESEEPRSDSSEDPNNSDDSSAVTYSTNSFEKAKQGNSGVFSYKRSGKNYDTYWIIDFDEGCAYWFTYGNGNSTCDRVQIDSGNLNEYIVVTYHDGGDTWQYGLSFKRKNQPDRLIEQHTDGEKLEFTATGLNDAVKIRDSMTIVDY
jgi:hypothetical protein